MTHLQDWIRFWLKRNDREFEEEAKRERELDKESDLPPDVLALFARLRQEDHARNQSPVGAFFDSINPRRHNGRKASAEKLFVVAEVGKGLLYEAICTPTRTITRSSSSGPTKPGSAGRRCAAGM
jgi:hypothetical protein